ncbi:MAG: WD40 repeat domain-containing protein [Planctomycetes bacterium]|nr:WD40 repeat domain-containing protein [Planctomycetota bacterium]
MDAPDTSVLRSRKKIVLVFAGLALFAGLIPISIFGYREWFDSTPDPANEEIAKPAANTKKAAAISEWFEEVKFDRLHKPRENEQLPESFPLIRTTNSDHQFLFLEFAPDSKTLLTRSHRRRLQAWDVLSGKELGVYHGDNALGMFLDFAPDGKHLVTYDRGNAIWLHELPALKTIGSLAPPSGGGLFSCGAISPNSKLAAISTGAGFAFWSLKDAKALGSEVSPPVRGSSWEIDSVRFGSSRHLIARGFSRNQGPQSHFTKVWDLATPGTPRELTSFPSHGNAAHGYLCLSVDRTILYLTSGVLDVVGRVDFVDWRADRCLLTIHRDSRNPFYSVALSSDNRRVLTGHLDGWVVVRDFPSGERLHAFQPLGDVSIRIALSPDDRILAVSNGPEIKLLSAKSILDN